MPESTEKLEAQNGESNTAETDTSRDIENGSLTKDSDLVQSVVPLPTWKFALILVALCVTVLCMALVCYRNKTHWKLIRFF